jgi:hypothetical protein
VIIGEGVTNVVEVIWGGCLPIIEEGDDKNNASPSPKSIILFNSA